jgi:hypothetical protein
MEANPEKMEANPDEMKSVTVREKVPKEEAAVKSFGVLKKQRGDRHLTVGDVESQRNGPGDIVDPRGS